MCDNMSGWNNDRIRHSVVSHGAGSRRSIHSNQINSFMASSIYVTPMKPNLEYKTKYIDKVESDISYDLEMDYMDVVEAIEELVNEGKVRVAGEGRD